ncbi:MAG: hypothetical protein II530_04875 [Bacteroidaceae bacterium]|nr:hypothetical protein [Bacteroidaceae bacterium]
MGLYIALFFCVVTVLSSSIHFILKTKDCLLEDELTVENDTVKIQG